MSSPSPSPFRAGSPLATPGPRSRVWLSTDRMEMIDRIAGELGLTQRIVLDAALQDEKDVRRKAIEFAARARINLCRTQDDDRAEPAASH